MKHISKMASIIASVAMACTCITFQLSTDVDATDATIESRTYKRYDMSTHQTTTYTLSLTPDYSKGIVSGTPNGNYSLSTDSRLIRCAGTGFIVGDHVIATNAHCIYSAANDTFGLGGYVTAFTFPDDEPEPHNLTVVSLHVPTLYRRQNIDGTYSGNENYDYGLIEVKEDLSEYGCFNLGLPLDGISMGLSTGKEVTVSGFPQAIINTPNGYRYSPVQSTGRVYNMSTYRIDHTADTQSGSSGSPIYTTTEIYGNTYDTVIGIHNSDVTSTHNGGVRMTQPILMFYLNNPNVS